MIFERTTKNGLKVAEELTEEMIALVDPKLMASEAFEIT